MDRIPEPELMNDEAQALAYAQADFSEPHSSFIDEFRRAFPGRPIVGHVVDLGCGPADITVRFAHAFPGCTIDGVDGAENMLKHGVERVAREGLSGRIHFWHRQLPDIRGLRDRYDAIICNSLLHHLADPATLWNAVKRLAGIDAPVFVMDLARPEGKDQAWALVADHAANEPEVLKQDFFNSLVAAYRLDEVEAQIKRADLPGLEAKLFSDRHWIAYGLVAPGGTGNRAGTAH